MTKNSFLSIKILFIVFLCSTTILLFPQKVSDLFLSMPDHLLPSLSKQHRFELIEYSKLNRKDSIKNRFENYVSNLYLDSINQQITFNTTKNNSIEIKVYLLDNNDTLVGVINTILKPFPLSTIQFFTYNWKPSAVIFDPPKSSAWLIQKNVEETNIDTNWLNKQLDNSYLTYTFLKTKPSIEVTNHLLDFINIEDKKLIGSLIEDKVLIYKLDKRKFVLSN